MAGKGLTPEQKRTALQILAAGRKAGLSSPMTDKAAIETGLVEAGLTNPDGGHADSGGWRQARRSIYSDVTNVQKTATDFYKEAAAAKGKYGTAGALAAAVQRPAAQYRGRYQDVAAQADQIIAELGGKRQTSAGQAQTKAVGGTPASFDQAGYDAAQRKQTVADYLTKRGKNYGGLSALFSTGTLSTAPVDKTQFNTAATPGTKVTVPGSSATGATPAAGSGGAAALGWAKSKLGFKETGTNAGGVASYLNQRFGMSNQPWCAMFTSAATTKGGAPLSARTASVAGVRAKVAAGTGYQKGYVPPASAKAGDLILWGNDHIGMVESVSNGVVHYVAGNESNGVNKGTVKVGAGNDIVRPLYGARKK